MTEEDIALLVALHLDCDRQGPGSDYHTRQALALTGLAAKEGLRIADIGCGTGASTLILAGLPGARVDAVDLMTPFLDRLAQHADAAGLGAQVAAHCADMADLPLEQGAYDLVWSEGAIYNMGFAAGIAALRPLLKPRGVISVSELTWLTRTRPDEINDHWAQAYPEVDTASAKMAVLEREGFAPLGYFTLPRSAWMEGYYTPLRDGFPAFLAAQGSTPAAQEIVAETQTEIDLYERYFNYVSYGFYIAERVE